MTVAIGKTSETFTVSGSTYTSTEGSGSALTYDSTTQIFTYTRNDGTVAHFSKPTTNLWSASYGNSGLVTDIVFPGGEQRKYEYYSTLYCKVSISEDSCRNTAYAYRLSNVVSSYGYEVILSYDPAYNYTYDSTQPMVQPNFVGWSTPISAKGYNLAVSANTAQTSEAFGTVTSAGVTSYVITDPLSRQTKFRMNGSQLLGITRPGDANESVTYTYTSSLVTSVDTPAGTTSYARSDSGDTRTVTVTDPLSHVTTYLFDIPSRRMVSRTDPLNHVTSYQYDASGRVIRVTLPEGNYVQYTYDARGNITEERHVSKNAGTPSDIVLSAGYPSSCDNTLTCNQPAWTKDALGNQTDYTYDSTHGGVLTATAPANGSSVRPQTRYSYTAMQAYYYRSGIIASGVTQYELTGVSTCLSATSSNPASCVGSASESKTSISYGPQSAGVGNNLLPISKTVAAGDASISATTAFSYDSIGNLISVDGPVAGTDDITSYRYDADRERIGVISGDPDGAGALKRRAVRTTYDVKGRPALVEYGTVTDASDAAWNAFSSAQQISTNYDGLDRPLSQTTSAGGTTYAVTQSSYDHQRLDCTTVRMNNGAWGSLPASACTAQAAGSEGPDRITKYSYDDADRTLKVTSAYGLSEQSDEVTITYTSNGKQQAAADANGNVTTYGYDGFDRLSTTTYPGGSYEQLSYNANSNVTSRRLRDGQVNNYGYDALDRLISVDRPNGVYWETDLGYAYNLVGGLTNATDSKGRNLGFSYDALGRKTSQSDNWNSWGNASMQYDATGRRTRFTWNDGAYVSYTYLNTGEMSAVLDSGGNTLIGFGYNDLGLRTSLSRANGTTTTYGYDAASRLSQLVQDLGGTAQDLTVGFSYNPAGQILSRTVSNDAYAWSGYYNVNRGYGVNVLNQYTSAGATSLGYDARGNLNNSGGTSYSYTTDNQLAVARGVNLAYDPLGRLFNGTLDSDTNTTLLYDGVDVMTEIDQNSGALLRRYVYGPGSDEPLIWFEGSGLGDRRWLHADERGSVIAITNDSGNAMAVNTYDQYGIPQSSNLGRFQYTGQKWLPTVGLYDYKARVYSPTLGRFMQTDPIGYGDGMNWYNYVHADPINATDPSGLEEAVGAIVVHGNVGCDFFCQSTSNAIDIDDLKAGLSPHPAVQDIDDSSVIVVNAVKPKKSAKTGVMTAIAPQSKPCAVSSAGAYQTVAQAALDRAGGGGKAAPYDSNFSTLSNVPDLSDWTPAYNSHGGPTQSYEHFLGCSGFTTCFAAKIYLNDTHHGNLNTVALIRTDPFSYGSPSLSIPHVLDYVRARQSGSDNLNQGIASDYAAARGICP